MTATRHRLQLKPRNDKRLRAGHLWVFSNEIDTATTPLAGLDPGAEVDVVSADGKWIGVGYANPASLIAVRLVSRDAKVTMNAGFFARRLTQAVAGRARIHSGPHGRMVFGDADGLPGLVLDRYGDHVVGQITTAGMESRRDLIDAAVAKVLAPKSLTWRNDVAIRSLEGLGKEVVSAIGSAPESLEVVESGTRFEIDFASSQKTGWFYDQTDNRSRLRSLYSDARVLDLFSYAGGWGLGALSAGAQSATLVDSASGACEAIQRSAKANSLNPEIVESDVFRFLDDALAQKRRFDVVVVDPPAFAKRKKDVSAARRAYRKLNEQAIRLVEPGGFLVTCSCSFHMFEDGFYETIHGAARHVDRGLQILARLEQSRDHPVHPAIAETRYLKGLVARVIYNDF